MFYGGRDFFVLCYVIVMVRCMFGLGKEISIKLLCEWGKKVYVIESSG